jgi:hypothetical protein
LEAPEVGKSKLDILECDSPCTRIEMRGACGIEVHTIANVAITLGQQRNPCHEVDVVNEAMTQFESSLIHLGFEV